ncbi:MAG: hypothetical protein ACQEV7_15230 [Bacillota bacterium]
MNHTIRKSDHHLEISFFLLRWLFLIVAPIVFYFLHQEAIGCVECTETESSNLVKMADDRLYEAKRAGRNTIIMNSKWTEKELRPS